MFYQLFLSIYHFLQFLIEYIYFIVAVENGGSKNRRNIQPMNKGLPKPWPYFPASLLYFYY